MADDPILWQDPLTMDDDRNRRIFKSKMMNGLAPYLDAKSTQKVDEVSEAISTVGLEKIANYVHDEKTLETDKKTLAKALIAQSAVYFHDKRSWTYRRMQKLYALGWTISMIALLHGSAVKNHEQVMKSFVFSQVCFLAHVVGKSRYERMLTKVEKELRSFQSDPDLQAIERQRARWLFPHARFQQKSPQ